MFILLIHATCWCHVVVEVVVFGCLMFMCFVVEIMEVNHMIHDNICFIMVGYD